MEETVLPKLSFETMLSDTEKEISVLENRINLLCTEALEVLFREFWNVFPEIQNVYWSQMYDEYNDNTYDMTYIGDLYSVGATLFPKNEEGGQTETVELSSDDFLDSITPEQADFISKFTKSWNDAVELMRKVGEGGFFGTREGFIFEKPQ